MKRAIILTSCFLAGIIFSQASLADASKRKIEKRYVYQGDDSARSICLAIAKNQPARLSRALKDQRFSHTDTRVHKRFTCNGKDLLSFSQESGADEVSALLAPKFGKEAGLEVAGNMAN